MGKKSRLFRKVEKYKTKDNLILEALVFILDQTKGEANKKLSCLYHQDELMGLSKEEIERSINYYETVLCKCSSLIDNIQKIKKVKKTRD